MLKSLLVWWCLHVQDCSHLCRIYLQTLARDPVTNVLEFVLADSEFLDVEAQVLFSCTVSELNQAFVVLLLRRAPHENVVDDAFYACELI